MAYNLVMNNPTYGTGRFGSSLQSGYGLTSDIVLPSTGVFTMECWVKRGYSGALRVICGCNYFGWIGISAEKAHARYGVDVNEVELNSDVTITDGAYHHLALVVGDSGGKLFVDGILQASNSKTYSQAGGTTPPVTEFGVGVFGGVGGYVWAGEIDEVALYSIEKYNSNFTVPTSRIDNFDTGLVALWHLDDNGLDSYLSSNAIYSILPNDANIIYSPYNWKVTNAISKTINSGAYLKLNFSGNSISIYFDLSTCSAPYSQIKYRIDAFGDWVTTTIAELIECVMPSETSSWGFHFLELVVKSTTENNDRWNSQTTAVNILGFTLYGGSISLPRLKSDKSIIFYGDSITEGVRTIALDAAHDLDRNDATITWCNRMAELLGVEFGNIGFGATGFIGTGSGNVPKLSLSYNNLWSGENRDFTLNPSLVIVNMGTNDGGSNTISEIISFLNGIISATQESTKIIMLRPFNGSQASNIQQAISGCSSPSRCVYIDTTGFFDSSKSSDGLHPYGYANEKIAYALANILKQYLYPNSGGSSFSPADFWNYLTSNPVVQGSVMERILNSASADFVGEIMANN